MANVRNVNNLAVIFSGRAVGFQLVALYDHVAVELEKLPLETLQSFIKTSRYGAYRKGELDQFSFSSFSQAASSFVEKEVMVAAFPKEKPAMILLAQEIENYGDELDAIRFEEANPLYTFRFIDHPSFYRTLKESLLDKKKYNVLGIKKNLGSLS